MSSLRVAVFGASGVLGRSLVPALLRRGHEVRAISRRQIGPTHEGVAALRSFPIDLLDEDQGERIDEAVSGCYAAIHIATAIPGDPGVPGAWEANTKLRVRVTERLIDACVRQGVGRYLQQSITLAYPDRGVEWIPEEVPLDDGPARASLCGPVRRMEALVRSAPLAWTILRGGTFVGAGTMEDALRGRLARGEATVAGDGRHYVTLVHSADVADAFALALESDASGAVYNVGAEPMRQIEHLTTLASLIGAPPPRGDGATARPPSHRCSSAAIARDLGWRATRAVGLPSRA